jgi:hypothetical protein
MSGKNLHVHMSAKDNPQIKEALDAYGDVMLKYQVFEDIPEFLRVEGALVAWIYARGHLKFIPSAYRTEQIFEVSVIAEDDALSFISPEETSQYEELAIAALKRNPVQVRILPDAVLTEAFLIKACSHSLAVIRYIDWPFEKAHLATPKLIREVGAQSLIHASELIESIGYKARSMLDEEVLRKAIKHSIANLIRLDVFKGKPLLETMLREGFWYLEDEKSIKFELSNGRDYRKPPSTPEEALSRLRDPTGVPLRILHSQSLKAFPIQDVIATLSRDAESLDVLFDLYTADELRPHMGLSRALRGRFLEQEIGL